MRCIFVRNAVVIKIHRIQHTSYKISPKNLDPGLAKDTVVLHTSSKITRTYYSLKEDFQSTRIFVENQGQNNRAFCFHFKSYSFNKLEI